MTDHDILDSVETKAVELWKWVRDHNGDVDLDAFEEGCREIAHIASGHYMVRRPVGLPEGLPTLDFALVLVRSRGTARSIPNDLAHDFPRLSGASFWLVGRE